MIAPRAQGRHSRRAPAWVSLVGVVGVFVVDGAAGICGPVGSALGFSGPGLGRLELLAGVSVRL